MVHKDKKTEQRIFEAATEEFLQKGMDGARMQDIADRAGIHKSLLNYYFRSKERLFNAVFEALSLQMQEKLTPLLDDTVPLEEKLRLFFTEHILFFQKNPRLPLFFLNEIARNPEMIRTNLQKLDVEKVFKVLNDNEIPETNEITRRKEFLIQILTSIFSISAFPFVAKGALDIIFERLGLSFEDYIEQRKQFAVEFAFAALKNMRSQN